MSTFYVLLVCFCALMSTERPAHAYLDPGTGSYTAQVIFAGLFVGLVSIRASLKRAFEYVSKLIKRR